MMLPVAQGYASVAFGDAQVDLALAEIEKGFSLPSKREKQSAQASAAARASPALAPQTQRS